MFLASQGIFEVILGGPEISVRRRTVVSVVLEIG
jgi:hypothetical protein